MRLDQAYRILDLEQGATEEEVRAAYRDLSKVWHPDRFAHDPAVQRKAEEKLKTINEAYETIRGARPFSNARASEPRSEPRADQWRVRVRGREADFPDLEALIAFVEGGVDEGAEVFDPRFERWLPLMELEVLRAAVGRGRAKRRLRWAVACALFAILVLFRRPSVGGLVIAAILFALAAALFVTGRRETVG